MCLDDQDSPEVELTTFRSVLLLVPLRLSLLWRGFLSLHALRINSCQFYGVFGVNCRVRSVLMRNMASFVGNVMSVSVGYVEILSSHGRNLVGAIEFPVRVDMTSGQSLAT